MTEQKIIKRILQLKKQKNAVILVHNYQSPAIYEVADFIGDSLDLSRKAVETTADSIVFCGVHFMAQTAKILNPAKKVLLPNLAAGCFLADRVSAETLEREKQKHPHAAVVCYINTTAEVKALCDICCTSGNAVSVVNSLKQKEILFVPDQNLAHYVSLHSRKKIIPWEGFCYVHQNISLQSLQDARKKFPDCEIIAHPECSPDVVDSADYVCGTGGMIPYAKKSKATIFFIATEAGMTERLRREVPEKTFYSLAGECSYMKTITLNHVLQALEKEQYEISIEENLRKRALGPIEKMLTIRD